MYCGSPSRLNAIDPTIRPAWLASVTRSPFKVYPGALAQPPSVPNARARMSRESRRRAACIRAPVSAAEGDTFSLRHISFQGVRGRNPGRIRWDRRRSRRDPPAGENDRRPCTLEQRGVLRRFAVAAADRRALAGNHHQGLVADFPPRAAAPSEIDSHFMGESGAAGCPSSSRISSCASSPPPATRSSAPGASRGSRRAWPRQSTRGTRVCSPVGRHPRWPSPYCRPSAPE